MNKLESNELDFPYASSIQDYPTWVKFNVLGFLLCLTMTSLFPYLYFMIQDIHVAKNVEDIGFYAGFVGAALMCGRVLTSFIWGVIADKWGRKPAIITGLVSIVVFNTLFGLSTSYWMAVSTRFLLGALNCIFGPMKAYATEVARPEYQSLGLSLFSTSWGLGLIAGPAIGGLFARPVENFPTIFSEESVFGRFPYLLPSLLISIFAAAVLVSCIWLPETLHNHPEYVTSDGKNVEKDEEAEINIHSHENLLLNWPLMSSIILFCVFTLQDTAFTEVFSLWAESDRKFGGLSFSTEDVGEVLAVTGISFLLFQLFFYPRAERRFGAINLIRLAAALVLPLTASFPYMANLSGLALKIVLSFASILKTLSGNCIFTGTFILQNNAVSQNRRGAANGIAMTLQSIVKTFAPVAAGIIFSWAQKRQDAFFLPGDQMVFFILSLIQLIVLLMTFKPFLATRT